MYHFIVNPNARSGLGFKIWTELDTVLKKRNVDYEVHFTKYRNHARKIAKELTSIPSDEPLTLVALGGDGTVDEVINGITDLTAITFGYIPIGSSNDFARGLKLPTDPLEALDMILNPTQITLLNIGTTSYKDKVRRFAVSAGFGFDADVCHVVCISPTKKLLNRLKLGHMVYTVLALDRLINLKKADFDVILDGKKRLHFADAYLASALNLPYQGGGCMFCPDADPTDDYLDFTVISGIPRIMAIPILLTVKFGGHTHFPGVHIYRCKSAKIHASVPLPVHSDGEPIYRQSVLSYGLEPAKLRTITKH